MSGFADPEDLLLELCQSFVLALDRKITSRNHYTRIRAPHQCKQQSRKFVEAFLGLYLQYNAKLLVTRSLDAFL